MATLAFKSDAEICALAQEAADSYLAPRAEEHDRTGEFPLDNLKQLAQRGLMGLMVPPQYGGLGGSVMQFTKVSEILAAACPSTSMIWGMHTNQYINLVEHGRPDQKEAILPGIARGEILCASGTTEPNTGGNFIYCNSSVRPVNGGWLYSGVKPVSTSAPFADYCFCVTRANPEAPGTVLSFFMVPCKGPGVTQIGEWNTVGLRATQSSGLKFEDAPLTRLHLLGEEGGFGAIGFATMLPFAMCGFAAVWLGAAQAAYNFALAHATRRRHSFSIPGDEAGHTLASYKSVQRQLAEASILLLQTRAFVYDVARAIDETKPAQDQPMPLPQAFPIADASLALRVASSENALAVTTTALRVAGAQGYRRDYLKIERCHRDALAGQVMAPAPDMVKVLLGKLRLGYTIEEATRLK